MDTPTAILIGPCSVRVVGRLGRRSSSFAFEQSTRLRWMGEEIGAYEIEFAKPRHARNFAKLQDRDMADGVL